MGKRLKKKTSHKPKTTTISSPLESGCPIVRVIEYMTEREAESFGVPEEEKGNYFKVVVKKNDFMPRLVGETTWFKEIPVNMPDGGVEFVSALWEEGNTK